VTAELAVLGMAALAALIYVLWARSSRLKSEAAAATLADIASLGDDLVPASLHPKVDPERCMGSGACVQACPEHDVIGIVGGRVELVNPLACVGHGACAAACPMDAIELVFGTAKRGVELPVVDETFQTSLSGVYVVGELGGMGLIRNAIRQGQEVGEYIHKTRRKGVGDAYDAIVVGAGPAGISATLQLIKDGLRVLLLEREAFGGTITHYPRAKVVMTGHLDLPGYGRVKRRTMSKEELVELWNDIRSKIDVPFREGELVSELTQAGDGMWDVHSTSGVFRAANVVLALGRRGSPRKLGVPGEDAKKVSYRVLEPEAFAGKNVLVVGGGNAAAECALALAEQGGCASVTISYRRPEFARLRGQVRERLDSLVAAGRVVAEMDSNVIQVGDGSVALRYGDGSEKAVRNDEVVVQIGGTPPSALLEKFGVDLVTKRGER